MSSKDEDLNVIHNVLCDNRLSDVRELIREYIETYKESDFLQDYDNSLNCLMSAKYEYTNVMYTLYHLVILDSPQTK